MQRVTHEPSIHWEASVNVKIVSTRSAGKLNLPAGTFRSLERLRDCYVPYRVQRAGGNHRGSRGVNEPNGACGSVAAVFFPSFLGLRNYFPL